MSKEPTMREIWDMIEAWLASNTPWIYDSLARGASEEEIRAVEVALGVSLPEDVRESYRIHNGQKPWRPFIDQKGTGFVYGDDLQDLAWITRRGQGVQPYAMVSDRRSLRSVIGPVKRELNKLHWVPLTDGANYMYYLDMDPAEGGDIGQVVLYIYDEGKAVRVNKSFRERLLYLAIRLGLGMYVYSDSIGCLVTVAELADEMEAEGLNTEEEIAEHRRLREIERLTTFPRAEPQ